jgi:hypothetical protein
LLGWFCKLYHVTESKHTPGLYAVLHEWLASKLSPDSIQALHRQSQQIPSARLCCTFQVGHFEQTLIGARSGVCQKWLGICPLQPRRRRHIPRRLAQRYGGRTGRACWCWSELLRWAWMRLIYGLCGVSPIWFDLGFSGSLGIFILLCFFAAYSVFYFIFD